MKKVVLNTQYGGFDLSQAAYRFLINRGWKVVEPSRVSEDVDDVRLLVQYTDEHGDTKYALAMPHEDPRIRTHPDIVLLVERIGEKASGPHAQLAIVEVPDGVS